MKARRECHSVAPLAHRHFYRVVGNEGAFDSSLRDRPVARWEHPDRFINAERDQHRPKHSYDHFQKSPTGISAGFDLRGVAC
jgi:hypothetical protein